LYKKLHKILHKVILQNSNLSKVKIWNDVLKDQLHTFWTQLRC